MIKVLEVLRMVDYAILSFTDFNSKIKISTRQYVLILIFKLKSVNDSIVHFEFTGWV